MNIINIARISHPYSQSMGGLHRQMPHMCPIRLSRACFVITHTLTRGEACMLLVWEGNLSSCTGWLIQMIASGRKNACLTLC